MPNDDASDQLPRPTTADPESMAETGPADGGSSVGATSAGGGESVVGTASADRGPSAGAGSAAGSTGEPSAKPIGGLLVAYTGGRLAVFVVLVLIFYLVGLRGLPGMVAGAVLSIPVSYFLLRTTRVELAARIADRKTAELDRKDAFRSAGKDD